MVSRVLLKGSALAALAALSACGPKAPPKLPPAPPPKIVIPPRPYPPMGSAPNLATPPMGIDGARRTVNYGLTDAQKVWNLRSAYNVAALNCQKPEHSGILEGYKEFLKKNAKVLTKVNKTIDEEFRSRTGATYVRAREAYMTQVYNYFALPPTLPSFCDAALAMANQSRTIAPTDLNGFALTSLPQIDSVFLAFFNSYDQYRADVAAWDARYGPPPAVIATPAAAAPATAPLPPAAASSSQGMAQ